jgi:hypothetical protein
LLGAVIQLGGDGEELSARNAALINLSRYSVIKEVGRWRFFRHHLIRSSSQGGGED